MRTLTFLALLLSAVALSSCQGVFGPRTCTLIGCNSGLEVVLEAPPTVPFRIEVEVPGQADRKVFQCPDPSRCEDRAIFSDFTPERVRIHVVTAAGTESYEVRPSYAEHRPNGSGCPPLCRTARVVLPPSPPSAT
jgi:hypothetical protein